MIRRLIVEIKPYPLLAGEQNLDDNCRRMVGVQVTTDVNNYSFTEIIQLDDWECLFDAVMAYAGIRIKEMIKQDEVKHGKKTVHAR